MAWGWGRMLVAKCGEGLRSARLDYGAVSGDTPAEMWAMAPQTEGATPQSRGSNLKFGLFARSAELLISLAIPFWTEIFIGWRVSTVPLIHPIPAVAAIIVVMIAHRKSSHRPVVARTAVFAGDFTLVVRTPCCRHKNLPSFMSGISWGRLVTLSMGVRENDLY